MLLLRVQQRGHCRVRGGLAARGGELPRSV